MPVVTLTSFIVITHQPLPGITIEESILVGVPTTWSTWTMTGIGLFFINR